MGTEKTRLLVCESIYWVNMNTEIEDTVKKERHVKPPQYQQKTTSEMRLKRQLTKDR